MFENTSKRIASVFKKLSGNSKITERNVEDAVEDIKNALLDADVNLRVLRRFVNSTLDEVKGTAVLQSVNPKEQFVKIVYDKITALLKGDGDSSLHLKGPDVVSVIVLMGLQGNGKTTTAGKLAYRLKSENRRVMLVACDLKRAAAVEQLKIVASDSGVEFYSEDTSDVCAIVERAISYAKKNQIDTVILDTAGRLSLDTSLMDELGSIVEVAKPDEKIFVADASIGQEAANIAKEFNEKIGITGVILTKFDSDTRGGAALSIASITQKSVKFVGNGEKKEDLDVFYPERIASRILGMGDVVSLVEQAQKSISEEEARRMEERLENHAFSIADYLMQLESVNKMGGFKKMLSMIPGLGTAISEDAINTDELKKEKAIMYSMTKKERDNYRLIGPPRRKRIARGAGVSIGDVDRFLRKFEKIRLTMRKVTKNKKLQSALLEKIGMLE